MRVAKFVLLGAAVVVGIAWWAISAHQESTRQTPTAAEMQSAVVWLKASDARFQRMFHMAANRTLTTAEVAMLDSEILEGERHRQRIKDCGDLAVLEEIDQYLATMRAMADGAGSR